MMIFNELLRNPKKFSKIIGILEIPGDITFYIKMSEGAICCAVACCTIFIIVLGVIQLSTMKDVPLNSVAIKYNTFQR